MNKQKLMLLYNRFNFFFRLYFSLKTKLLEFEIYTEYLSNLGTIVDIGCGYGLVANYLALCFPSNKVIGIDINAKRISVASKTIGDRKNIQFFNADAIGFSIPEKCVLVIMTDFLHHVSRYDQKNILQCVYNNLQEDGIALIAEVDPSIKPFYKYWQSYCADHVLYPFTLIYFNSPDIWVKILTDVGFKVSINRPNNFAFARVNYVCKK